MVYLADSFQHELWSIPVYYTFQCISIVVLLILLLVFILQKRKRHPTLWNLVIALIIDSTLHCALIGSPPVPSTPLAVITTCAAISGILATTGSFAAIIIRTWIVVVVERSVTVKWERAMNLSLVMVPWAVCVIMFIASVVPTALHPENIQVTALGPYNTDGRVTYPSRAIAALFLILAVVFEAWTIYRCVLNPRLFRGGSGEQHSHSHSQSNSNTNARYVSKSPFDFGFTARTLFFGGYACCALFLAIISLFTATRAPALYQSLGGIVAVIVFGTQRGDDHFAMEEIEHDPSTSTYSISSISVKTEVTVVKEDVDEYYPPVLEREEARRDHGRGQAR